MLRRALWFLYLVLGFEAGMRVFWIQTALRSYKIPISMISAALYIPYIPWCLKFVPWMISSRWGFRGHHRKPHILLGLLGCALTLIPLSFPCSLSAFLGLFFMFHWWIVWAWVNIVGCVVEDSLLMDEDARNFYQLAVLIVEAVGSLIGLRVGGRICIAMANQNSGPVISGIYGFLFLFTFAALPDYGMRRPRTLSNAYGNGEGPDLTVAGKERPVPVEEAIFFETETVEKQWAAMRDLLGNPYLRGVLLYNLLYSLFPSYDTAFWYMQQEILHFTPDDMGFLGAIGEAGKIIALVLFYFMGNRVRIRCFYIILGTLTVVTSIPPLLLTMSITYDDQEKVYLYDSLGLSPVLLVMGRNVFGELFDKLHALPPHQLASLLCRTAASAGALAAMGSASNFITGVGKLVDAGFYHLFGVDSTSFVGLKNLVWLRIALDSFSCLITFTLPNISISRIVQKDIRSRSVVVQQEVGEEFTTDNAL